MKNNIKKWIAVAVAMVMSVSVFSVSINSNAEAVNPAYATIPPTSWGTNGNENSVGIQADRMKNYVSGKDNTVTVAVLDSGIDSNHTRFTNRLVSGWGYNNTTNDENGHGSHVAGTIVDCTPNNVKILPVKVLDASSGIATTTALQQGIIEAVNAGARVVNMSIGWHKRDENSFEFLSQEDAIIQEIIDAIE